MKVTRLQTTVEQRWTEQQKALPCPEPMVFVLYLSAMLVAVEAKLPPTQTSLISSKKQVTAHFMVLYHRLSSIQKEKRMERLHQRRKET
jgi:hypothetical protein